MGRPLPYSRGRRKEGRTVTPEQAKEHLLEVAASGIVTRMRKYVEIQLDAETWDALQDWKKQGAALSEIGRDTGDYKRGFEDGVRAYAWHKDGHQEDGTTGKTLKNALANVEKTWNYQP